MINSIITFPIWKNDGKSVESLNKVQTKSIYETLSKLCKHYSKGGKTLDFFAELLDPDENGFELEIAGNHKLPYNREVWTDGTSILIESEVFDNLEE